MWFFYTGRPSRFIRCPDWTRHWRFSFSNRFRWFVELSHHVSISVNVAKHSHIPKVEKQNRYLKPHLPSHIFTNKKNLTNNQNTSKTVSKHPITLSECPICFEILGQNPLASTKCGHVYCMECIKKHLLIDRRCPTCRKYLKGASSYHSLYLST